MPASLSLTALPASLDALSNWRRDLSDALAALVRQLGQADLLGASAAGAARALEQRLATSTLVIATAGASGRGKSSVLNALLSDGAGHPLLPAGAGGYTACPIELAWWPALPPTLDLLPIATRRQSTSLVDWFERREQWQRHALVDTDPAALAEALIEAARVRPASRRRAASLGLLPAGVEADQIPVPVWRHALANLPHPLLQRGLVVLDTPGLDSLAVEPELTLGLLPRADLLLFVLSADAGLQDIDRALWMQHAQGRAASCLVVLDHPAPAARGAGASRRAEPLRRDVALALGVPLERVLPVSSAQASQAMARGDAAALAASGFVDLDLAVGRQLLALRQRALASELVSGVLSLLEDAKRRLRDQRREHAEQMLGLRGLRSESSDRYVQLQARLHADAIDLEACTARIDALVIAQHQAQRHAAAALDASYLRAAAAELKMSLAGGLLRAPWRSTVFATICQTLRGQVDEAALRCQETATTWDAAFAQFNAELGWTLTPPPLPDLARCHDELALIERGYSRYFSLGQSVRMATQASTEPLRRMLVAKLRGVFADAQRTMGHWHRGVIDLLQDQLVERRQQLQRRQAGLNRIQLAAGELEQHLSTLEAQDAPGLASLDRAQQLAHALTERAERGPGGLAGNSDAHVVDQTASTP